MKRGILISSGEQSELFMYGPDTLVKLFRKGVSSRHVYREANNTRTAMAYGLPVPALKDIIEIDGREGIVMEYIKGPTITNILRKAPHKINLYAQKFARLQADLHSISVKDFPNQREFMENTIKSSRGRLGMEITEKILQLFLILPDSDRLCHNDFHQENVIFSAKGPIILDWQEALRGNPIADVVHAILVQEHPVPAPILKNSSHYFQLHNKYRKLFAKLYQKEYMKLTNISLSQISDWLIPVSTTRLFTKVSLEEKEWTEKYIRRKMAGITD